MAAIVKLKNVTRYNSRTNAVKQVVIYHSKYIQRLDETVIHDYFIVIIIKYKQTHQHRLGPINKHRK